MTFEGKQIEIPVKGIIRIGTDNLCVDGAMNEVIGMEYKDGSWVPYAAESESLLFVVEGTSQHINVEKVSNHKCSDLTVNTFVLSSDVLYRVTGKQNSMILCAQMMSGVLDVEFIGNMVNISTENGLYHYLWNGSEYEQYNEDTSEILINMRVSSGMYEKDASEDTKKIGVSYVSKVKGEYILASQEEQLIKDETNRASVISGLIAAEGVARDKGGLTGYVLGCYAFRMKNGEFRNASMPVLLGRPSQLHGSEEDGYRESHGGNTLSSEQFYYKAAEESGYTNTVAIPIKGKTPESYTTDYSGMILPIIETDQYAIYESPTEDDLKTEDEEVDINGLTKTGEDYIYSKLNTLGSYGRNGGLKIRMDGQEISDEIDVNTPYIPTLMCTRTHLYHKEGATVSELSVRNSYIFNSYAATNKLQYEVKSLPADLDASMIDSICFFISPEVSPFDLSKNIELDFSDMVYDPNEVTESFLVYEGSDYSSANGYSRAYVKSYQAKYRPESDILKEISETKSLYLVKEVHLSDLETGGGWIDIDLEGKLGDALLTCTQLPISAFYQDKILSSNLSSYNSRLHVYDYSQSLFDGYSLYQMMHFGGDLQHQEDFIRRQSSSGDEEVRWEIKVTLKDNEGISSVVRWDEGLDQIRSSLSPMIVYPNFNAEKISIRIYYCYKPMPTDLGYSGAHDLYNAEFNFKHNEYLGISYYINPTLTPIVIPKVEIASGVPEVPTELPANNIRHYSNRLKVSDALVPSYFPLANTYTVGNGRIVGIARLSMPISQDNYGAYSLIVFTTDGVYTMGVDETGATAYPTITYFQPDVCVNKNSICEIGGAVLFATDRGLMVLSSSSVEEFVGALNGKIRFAPSSSGGSKSGDRIYYRMLSEPSIVGPTIYGDTDMINALSDEDFMEFITYPNTFVKYVPAKDKVIVYNKDYEYIYLIDLETRNATKLSGGLLFDDSDYPTCTFYNKTVMSSQRYRYTANKFTYDGKTSTDDDSVGIRCLIQSRPIKIQQDDKRSFRLVLTGYFEGEENKWADLVVFGSLDGTHWRAIGIKEKRLKNGFHNLGCVTERGSWKYLMFIFAGTLSERCHIDSICVTAEGVYNNKKR